jgi:hypothetical protein
MSYGRSMLRGYDRSTAKIIAAALHISDYVPSKGGGKRMKIPMSTLKKEDAKSEDKKKGKMNKFQLKRFKKEEKTEGE